MRARFRQYVADLAKTEPPESLDRVLRDALLDLEPPERK
jgi:hypothetical protein